MMLENEITVFLKQNNCLKRHLDKFFLTFPLCRTLVQGSTHPTFFQSFFSFPVLITAAVSWCSLPLLGPSSKYRLSINHYILLMTFL